MPNDHSDAFVAKMHGDFDCGSEDEALQAFDVTAYANELFRDGRPFLDFHTLLYA